MSVINASLPESATSAASPSRLVLLPGLDGTGTTFDAFVSHRPVHQEVQVIGYPADKPAGYDELLELVWEQLPRDQPYFLLGESFSGPLAVRAAARRPRGLMGVVLCASFVQSPSPWYLRRFPSMFTPAFVQRLIRLEAKIMRSLLGKRQDPLSRSAGRLLPNVCPEVIAARVRATLTVDVTRELQQIEVPLMYLAGRWDLVIPRRCQRLIQKFQPQAVIEMIDGPHALLQTRPVEAWAILNAWCDRNRFDGLTMPLE